MKIFISSLISGFEDVREAAKEAVVTLGHEPLMAEHFGARPDAPQVACLAEVRSADVVVMILGARYGAPQHLGISATHEEFNEARERKMLLVFVQDGIDAEPAQRTFIDEVQNWRSGRFRDSFATPDELRRKLTRALASIEVSNAKIAPDEREMIARAIAGIPKEDRNGFTSGNALHLSIAGPRQSVLRPSELEATALADFIKKEALFGPQRLFRDERGTKASVSGHLLRIEQKDTHGGAGASVTLSEDGSIVISLPFERDRDRMSSPLPAIVEEQVRDNLMRALGFASALLDRVDEIQRVDQVVLLVAITGSAGFGWRTQREHDASPHAGSMSMWGDKARTPVHLAPPVCHRSALKREATRIVEDFVTLLRRQFKER